MRRHHEALQILSEMNLTNLLDTAFILLIAFMLVAPMLKHGIELDLPKVSRKDLQTEAKTITIVIAKSPEEGFAEPIYVEDQRVDLEGLEAIIRDTMEKFANFSVAIEGDEASSLGTFAQVVGLLQNLGVEKIGLVTEPLELE